VAKEFVDSGDYLWNSGIFIASAKQILVEIARHSPVIKRYALKALEQARVSAQAYYVAPQQYSKCPSVPFDIAVMEQTDRAHVIPYMGVWNDLGTWESILAHSILDQDSNSIKGNVYHNKCENSLLWGHTRPLVVLGIENVVVIDTPVAILVSGGECIQEVKAMVEKVSVSRPIQVGKVASSDRPWGSFEVLEVAEGYKVKRLTVKPGGKLSLQRPRLRCESWTVIAGQAWVTCDSTFKKLEVGESTYIAQGSIHRLENKASLPLVVMEVQFGSYLEEDDIERLEDIYDRKCS
jgi:mannose-1-phosphate guanylyltransferase/mannose-6-phosphate isomerase